MEDIHISTVCFLCSIVNGTFKIETYAGLIGGMDMQYSK